MFACDDTVAKLRRLHAGALQAIKQGLCVGHRRLRLLHGLRHVFVLFVLVHFVISRFRAELRTGRGKFERRFGRRLRRGVICVQSVVKTSSMLARCRLSSRGCA